MNKETFDKIQATLEGRIAACKFYLGNIETTDDLKQLTIEQAQVLQQFCRVEETRQTKIMQCDLYHIIGMGELTPPQMMKFTYLIRDYLEYRGALKTIAMNFDKISQLPRLPVSAIYKTHGFEGLSLVAGHAIEEATVLVPYSLSGNLIKVSKDRVTEFIEFWIKKSKTPLSESNFMQKVNAGQDYGGIQWSLDINGDIVGVFQMDNVRQLFEGCYKTA